jgi:hypothetical protein
MLLSYGQVTNKYGVLAAHFCNLQFLSFSYATEEYGVLAAKNLQFAILKLKQCNRRIRCTSSLMLAIFACKASNVAVEYGVLAAHFCNFAN